MLIRRKWLTLWIATAAWLWFGDSANIAKAQELSAKETQDRITVDGTDEKGIHITYYCFKATGDTKQILDTVSSWPVVGAIIKPVGDVLKALALSKGDIRCYQHSAWQKIGMAPTLKPTGTAVAYVKLFAGGKPGGGTTHRCNPGNALCRVDISATAGGDKADGILACFEWDGSKTSDKQPRSFFVAIGAVSEQAKGEHGKVESKLCKDRPQA